MIYLRLSPLQSLEKSGALGKLVRGYAAGPAAASAAEREDVKGLLCVAALSGAPTDTIGATVDKVVPAPEDPKGFKVVQVMSASLSADHRTVDGAVGSRWLKAFKDYMEQPLTFML